MMRRGPLDEPSHANARRAGGLPMSAATWVPDALEAAMRAPDTPGAAR